MARELRLKPVYLMGHLHALWHAALEQQEDGDLSSWSDELIAELSAYPGDGLQYVSLLRKHGWLDGKILHDWWDYAGRYLIRKYGTSNPERLKIIKENLERAQREPLKSHLGATLVAPPNLPEITKPKEKKKHTRMRATLLPLDFGISDRVRTWAEKHKYDRLDDHLEAFKRKCEAKDYQYVNWDSAFMEAIREDWAKIRGGRFEAQILDDPGKANRMIDFLEGR